MLHDDTRPEPGVSDSDIRSQIQPAYQRQSAAHAERQWRQSWSVRMSQALANSPVRPARINVRRLTHA